MVKYIITAVLFFALLLTFIPKGAPLNIDHNGPMPVVLTENITIRLLALKHAREPMADGDANLAIKAVEAAAAKGLSISTIGNHFINRNGKIQVVVHEYETSEQVQQFVSEQMKINATPGDTVVVFTIGHGHANGGLQTLGQRDEIMKALAQAAEDNNQRTLWWQLSCHAAAKLPSISSLSPKQQELFSVLASSTASQLSPAYVEGHIMQKVFVAMAEKSKNIDTDGDSTITAKELSGYLNQIRSGRGNLLFAQSPDTVIFGQGFNILNLIPIFDIGNNQKKYPEGYVPSPNK